MTAGGATYGRTRRALERGETTCEQVVAGSLEMIAKGKRLNAFLSVFEQEALERARDIDRKYAAGSPGPLAGMVVAVKDVLCQRGKQVTCSSRILQDFVSPYDATALSRMCKADAIVIGRTNMDEFAMGSSTENSAFGPVLNPVDETRVPGGSSGGSCVAVAAQMAHTALGTDTGGSIRQPASFCGVVGLKPTYGRVSRYGLVALASSFDQIGPFASCVEDAASVLQVIAGQDPLDSTSAPEPVPEYRKALQGDLAGVKVGVPAMVLERGLQREVAEALARALEACRKGGAIVREIDLPHAEYVLSTYYILMTAEASSNLARYDGARYGYRTPGARTVEEMYVRSRSGAFGAETKRRIMLGTYVLSAGYYDAYYRKAQKVRRLIQTDYLEAFRSVDCILMPTSPTTAFRIGEKADDPLQMYLSDVFTVSANLAGIPALSVPYGRDGAGLPIGVQILGRHFDERTILQVGHFLEQFP